ncbi:unnamed protein product, partial [Brassica oleracea var. botrytis]
CLRCSVTSTLSSSDSLGSVIEDVIATRLVPLGWTRFSSASRLHKV